MSEPGIPPIAQFRVSTRGRVFFLVIGPLLLGLPCTAFIAGWNDTPDQTTLWALLALAICLFTIQGIQGAMELHRDRICRRYLGFWVSRRLPVRYRFEPSRDRTGDEGLARRILKAPPMIAIVNSDSGKEITRIDAEFLAGMSEDAYLQVLQELNNATL